METIKQPVRLTLPVQCMIKELMFKKNKTTFIKNKIFIILASIMISLASFSQKDSVIVDDAIFVFDETIVTDRPDQTEAPNLTPSGWFQIEVGALSEFDNNKETKTQTQSTLYNTTLWKYGVTKNFELRLITEYANDKLITEDTSIAISYLAPIIIGSKIRICEERGIRPKISLISHLELPYFGNADFRPNYVIPRFRFLMAHTLSERFSFSYNLGGEWEDGASNATMIYTASLGIKLLKKLNMFVESYGFLRENSTADNRLDGGLTYLISNNIQLDASGGIGLSEISPDYFISCGLSFRLNAFDKFHKTQK